MKQRYGKAALTLNYTVPRKGLKKQKKESLFSWALPFLCLHLFVRAGICYQHAMKMFSCSTKKFLKLMQANSELQVLDQNLVSTISSVVIPDKQ